MLPSIARANAFKIFKGKTCNQTWNGTEQEQSPWPAMLVPNLMPN